MTARDSTALMSSTTLKPIEGFGGLLVPTAAERAKGRFMRAPDGHDAGAGDGGNGGDGSDAGAGKGADAGAGDGGDAGAGDSGADAGDGKGGDDDTTVLGSATAGDGAGDDDGEGKKDGEDGEGDGEGDLVVPETYELKVATKDAEGKDVEVEIDTDLLAEATPILKELNLTNDQANKLAPFVVKAIDKAFAKQGDEFSTVKADWAKEAAADPEIGGKNWKATQSLAAKALDHFVGPVTTKDKDGNETPNEFRKLLDESGLGNHPAMIRAFRKIGEGLAEDGTFARSDTGAPAKPPREEVMYPNDVPKVK